MKHPVAKALKNTMGKKRKSHRTKTGYGGPGSNSKGYSFSSSYPSGSTLHGNKRARTGQRTISKAR